MTLFINQLQYVPVLSPQAGLRMILHRQGEVPLVAEDGFNLSPGTKSGVSVKYVSFLFPRSRNYELVKGSYLSIFERNSEFYFSRLGFYVV